MSNVKYSVTLNSLDLDTYSYPYSVRSTASAKHPRLSCIRNLFCIHLLFIIRCTTMRFEEKQSNRCHAIATLKTSTSHSTLTAKTVIPYCLPELSPEENIAQPIRRC